MALKAIMVAVAVFVVVAAVAASQASAMEEEKEAVVEAGNGWKMVKHLRLLEDVKDSSVEQKSNGGVSMKKYAIKTIAIPRQLKGCEQVPCNPDPNEPNCPGHCDDSNCSVTSEEPENCSDY